MLIKEFNKDTMVVLPIPAKGKYLYTIEEALTYIVENDKSWLLGDMMFNNVAIRDAIRTNGIKVVVDKLRGYAPISEKMKQELDRLVERDIHVEDFDIQVLPVDAKLNFYGMKLNYPELVNYMEIAKRLNGGFSDAEPNDTLHVAAIYDRYPCFDSYDYANEKRCYVNLFVGNHIMTKDDCLEIEKSPHISNCRFIHDGMDTKCLPAVYYVGEGDFVYVATTKDNPQITPEELVKEM